MRNGARIVCGQRNIGGAIGENGRDAVVETRIVYGDGEGATRGVVLRITSVVSDVCGANGEARA